MSSWFGRLAILMSVALGANLTFHNQASSEVPRFISIVVAVSNPDVGPTLQGRAGSIDNIQDTLLGLLIEGSVSGTVDEVRLIVDQSAKTSTTPTALLPRARVAGVEGEQGSTYTGFKEVLPGLTKSAILCVMYNGPSGSAVLWQRGKTCD